LYCFFFVLLKFLLRDPLRLKDLGKLIGWLKYNLLVVVNFK